MTRDAKQDLLSIIGALERRVHTAEDTAAYYRMIAAEAGKRSVREIDKLSRLFEEHKRIEARLAYRLDLNKLLNRISTRLLSYPSAHIDEGVTWALGTVAEFFLLDRGYVFALERGALRMTHCWVRPDTDFPEPEGSLLAPGLPRFERFRAIMFGNPDELDDEYLAPFRHTGIRALMAAPLMVSDELVGVIGFDLLHANHTWHEEDLIICRTLADLVVNAIERKRNSTEMATLREQLSVRQRMDSLGALAAGIAHDFNNLLMTIMGNIEILRVGTDPLTTRQKELLDRACRACKHAEKLVAGIQNVTASRTAERQSVDLHTAAREVFDMLERTTDNLIEKQLDIEPGRFYVTADPSQLNQVLLNLATNAVHAIEDRGTRAGDHIGITARKHTVDEHDRTGLPRGSYVHIIFSDTGSGMSEAVRRKAFEPLFTTRHGIRHGQGLGLATVYNIITRTHEGHVDIESTLGRGTSIHLYLPIAPPAPCPSEPLPPTVTGGSETVLVIEDDDAVRELTSDVLRNLGYTVYTAADGREGLHKFQKYHHRLDLVFLDLSLPLMSGASLFRYISHLKPGMKIILSSGHGVATLEQFGEAAGILPKPFSIGELALAVRAVLDT